MAHAVEAALEQRLAEINEILRPFLPLIEEKTTTERLLAIRHALNDASSQRPEPEPAPGSHGPPPHTARDISYRFVADPNSKTSRVLAKAKEMLQAETKLELPFLTIYRRLPPELVGKTRNAREHIRGILQQKGDRVGIDYVDAEHVRLVAQRAA